MSTGIRRCLARWTVAATLLAWPATARPTPMVPFVTVGAGLPAPIRSLGYDTRGEATRQRPARIPYTLECTVGVDRWARGWGRATVVLSRSAIKGRGDARAGSARWWVVGATPELVWRPTPRADIALGPAIGALAFTLVVDENLRLQTASLGGGGGVSIGATGARGVQARFTARSWWFGDPLVRDFWFNQPLGRTHLVTATVGVAWSPTRRR